jgi:hypothetical protein
MSQVTDSAMTTRTSPTKTRMVNVPNRSSSEVRLGVGVGGSSATTTVIVGEGVAEGTAVGEAVEVTEGTADGVAGASVGSTVSVGAADGVADARGEGVTVRGASVGVTSTQIVKAPVTGVFPIPLAVAAYLSSTIDPPDARRTVN